MLIVANDTSSYPVAFISTFWNSRYLSRENERFSLAIMHGYLLLLKPFSMTFICILYKEFVFGRMIISVDNSIQKFLLISDVQSELIFSRIW